MKQDRKPFKLKERLISFRHAFAGMRNLLAFEHNARIHLLAAFLAVILGFVLRISLQDWALLAIAVFVVFVAEIFNSAIEKLADAVSPEYSEKIRLVKDYCAAGVLLASILAVVLGLIVFLPDIISRL